LAVRDGQEAGVLWINQQYLFALRDQLETMLTDVTNQANGAISTGSYSGVLPVVDQNLNIIAPGGSGGSNSTFQIAADLNIQISKMGGSVAQVVTYLQNVFTDMIQEIETTANAMNSTETLNAESASQLMTDLQQTITDINAGPGSGSSGSGSGSGSSGSK
jgi:hypothetical protein